MDARRFTRLREVVDRALALPPTDRDDFVRAACADDPELGARALDLLARDTPRGAPLTGALEDQVREAATRAMTADPLPAAIGPYRIVAKLGEGGMGVVYRAEQTGALVREVALKLIREGWNSRRVVARFESERLALARMDHPNIARVFDAGTTDDNRPWFAMELVAGESLTAWCDTHRLTTRDRIGLFLDVCRGVQHAHRKGIIHRDLKPSNVLVSGTPRRAVPKIIDFGIAKALSDRNGAPAAVTLVGQQVGSPDYMSPEHLEGEDDLDIRSDIYSLGVLLFELLSGRRPFDRGTRPGAGAASGTVTGTRAEPPSLVTGGTATRVPVAEIAAQRGSDPRRLRRTLRGELDWIVAKALAPDRDDRYETVRGLMLDLERYLDGNPVLAGRPPLSYRAGKFVRRHRVPVVVTLVVVAALTFGLVESHRQRLRADAARVQAQAVTDFLSDMLASVQPDEEGRDVTVRQILDDAAATAAAEFADEPLVRAQLQTTIGRAYESLGENKAAIAQLEAALADRRRELGGEAPETLLAMCNLGSSLSREARFERAAALYAEALAGFRRLPGGHAAETCQALNGLANALADQGRADDAEPYYEEGLALAREQLGERDPQTSSLLNNLAILRADQGRMPECRDLLAQVLAVRRQTLGDDNTKTMESVLNLASIESQLGNLDEAIAELGPLVARARQVVGSSHRITLAAMNNLAWAYVQAGRLDEADRMYTDTLELRRRQLGPDHPETLITAFNLADLRARQGRVSEADDLFRRTLETRLRVLGPDHPHTRFSVDGYAEFLRAQGNAAGADSLLAAHP